MRVAIGCDHGGLVLKNEIIKVAKSLGYEIQDFGTNSTESVDYPKYAKLVAEAVASGNANCGILMCGTGIGMSIAANKVKGIRCALVSDLFSAKATKQHNNTNVIALGGRVISPEFAGMLAKEWLTAEFEGDRHQKRIDMISDIENNN